MDEKLMKCFWFTTYHDEYNWRTVVDFVLQFQTNSAKFIPKVDGLRPAYKIKVVTSKYVLKMRNTHVENVITPWLRNLCHKNEQFILCTAKQTEQNLFQKLMGWDRPIKSKLSEIQNGQKMRNTHVENVITPWLRNWCHKNEQFIKRTNLGPCDEKKYWLPH